MESISMRDMIPLILAKRSPQDIVAYCRGNKNIYQSCNENFWATLIRIRWGTRIYPKLTAQREYYERYKDDIDLLVDAARTYKLRAIRTLVNKGIDVDRRDRKGQIALIEAINKAYMPIIKYLIDIGADVNVEDVKGDTPFLEAANTRNNTINIVNMLIEAGLDLPIKTKEGNTALIWAAKIDHVELIRLLLDDYQVDIDERGESNGTALIWAVRGSKLNAVKTLLEYAPDQTLRDKWGVNALEWAYKKINENKEHHFTDEATTRAIAELLE